MTPEIESLRDECKRLAMVYALSAMPAIIDRCKAGTLVQGPEYAGNVTVGFPMTQQFVDFESALDRLAGAVSQPNLTVLRAWSALQEAEPGDRWAEGYDAARSYVHAQLGHPSGALRTRAVAAATNLPQSDADSEALGAAEHPWWALIRGHMRAVRLGHAAGTSNWAAVVHRAITEPMHGTSATRSESEAADGQPEPLAQQRQDEQDAARYRWLRDESFRWGASRRAPYVCVGLGEDDDPAIAGADLDAVVDIAIAQAQEGK